MDTVKKQISKARKETNTHPTEGQIKSGNYKKGKVRVCGFEISLENPKGTYRYGVNDKGEEWKVKMNNDYGYFLNTEGYDGDHIDVFLGDNLEKIEKVFVVDQKKGNKFDESKVMLGFKDENEAKRAYMSNYEKGWNGFQKITTTDIDIFKKWLYDGKKQRKPFYQYNEIKTNVKKMKIKESQLRNLIRESINRILMKEDIMSENIYTYENWIKDGSLKPKIGQYVSDDVIEELLNSLPPTTHSRGIFQPGEAYAMSEDYTDLYMTFARKNGYWQYIGLCPKGSAKQVPEMRFESIHNKTINEGKRGLNSPKLYQISKEHGGLKPEHTMYTLRFNEFTDDDVIGVVKGDELKVYKNASYSKKKEWAEKKGYVVNRGDEVVFIPMTDWTWVAVIERGSLLPNKEWQETPYGKKRIERGLNRTRDGKKTYIWTDTDFEGKHGLKGWTKRGFQFAHMKSNNDLRNSKLNK